MKRTEFTAEEVKNIFELMRSESFVSVLRKISAEQIDSALQIMSGAVLSQDWHTASKAVGQRIAWESVVSEFERIANQFKVERI